MIYVLTVALILLFITIVFGFWISYLAFLTLGRRINWCLFQISRIKEH